MVCEVIVDRKNFLVNQPFDYSVPKDLEEVIKKGMRGIAEFNKIPLIGYVVNIKDHSEFKGLKPLIKILDIAPCLTEELLYLAYNMHKYYFSFYVNSLEAMIPQALKGKYETSVTINDSNIDKEILDLFSSKQSFILTK